MMLLTPASMRAMYDYFVETPPFSRWNLPDSEDVVFKVSRGRANFGWHTFDGVRHVVFCSSALIGRTVTLAEVMAHEMIHVHEQHSKACVRGVEHSAAFRKWAGQVCRVHGFDPKIFC